MNTIKTPTRKNTPTTNTGAELLTINEVAKILRCDPATVRRWIKQNALEAVRLPHLNKSQSYRIRRSVINNLLNTSKQA